MKKVLLISPTPSHPQDAGNRARVYSLLSFIQDTGCQLHFLWVAAEGGGQKDVMRDVWGNHFHHAPYQQPMSTPGIVQKLQQAIKGAPHAIDKWYDPALNKTVAQLHRIHKFDVVLVEYVFFSQALECFGPNVCKIVDTIDVFSNRHERMLKHGLEPNWYSTTPAEEARGLNRADIVIAISEEDRQNLSRLVSRKVITVGHIIQQYQPAQRSSSSDKILFVASANPMNAQGIQFFANEVFPLIKEQRPSAKLLVAGTVCALLEDNESYIKLGKQDDLRPLYVEADVIINPMLYGTGLSIKSLEALGQAKPLVTTSIGARGLIDGAGEAFLVADTPESFAAAVTNLLADMALSKRLAHSAYDFVRHWNQQNTNTLKNILDV